MNPMYYILIGVIVLVVAIDLYLKNKKKKSDSTDIENFRGTKKKKTILNLMFFLFFGSLLVFAIINVGNDGDLKVALDDLNSAVKEYTDSKSTKYFISRWSYNDGAHKYKYVYEFKYAENKLYYQLSIVAGEGGTDITNHYITNENKLMKIFKSVHLIEDIDGFVLFKIKDINFNLRAGVEPPEYIYKGKYYQAKGDIFLSKDVFKKINKSSIVKRRQCRKNIAKVGAKRQRCRNWTSNESQYCNTHL